jgi:hypothetical protein
VFQVLGLRKTLIYDWLTRLDKFLKGIENTKRNIKPEFLKLLERKKKNREKIFRVLSCPSFDVFPPCLVSPTNLVF